MNPAGEAWNTISLDLLVEDNFSKSRPLNLLFGILAVIGLSVANSLYSISNIPFSSSILFRSVRFTKNNSVKKDVFHNLHNGNFHILSLSQMYYRLGDYSVLISIASNQIIYLWTIPSPSVKLDIISTQVRPACVNFRVQKPSSDS